MRRRIYAVSDEKAEADIIIRLYNRVKDVVRG